MKPQKMQRLLLAAAAMLFVAAAMVNAVDVGASAAAVFKGGTGEVLLPMRVLLRRVTDLEDAAAIVEEEEEAVAYPLRRVLQSSSTGVTYGSLEANKAACYGPCPARGQPYSGRGCKSIYQCNN